MAPARPRLPAFSAAVLAALAAVLAVLLPSGTASAASVTAAETRVWAFPLAAHDHVGADRLVSAGQRLGDAVSCPICAPGACVAPEAAGAAAPELSSGGGSTGQIFRNVDAREFDSIAATGKFGTGPGQMEGKWFATQGAHAGQWGQVLNGGQGLTVETNIPRTVADQLFFHAGKLDGIGPAYYANEGQLSLINQFMDGIRVWP